MAFGKNLAIVVLVGLVIALALIVGLAVGLTVGDKESESTNTTISTTPTIITSTTTTTTTLSTTTTTAGTTTTAVSVCPNGVTGWCEWSSWSSCTHSCGNGEKSRLRACSNEEGGIERRSSVSKCHGEAVEVSPCNEGQCQTGLKMVTEIVIDLRERLNLEDNLFLNRYAQSVTDNGEKINANETDEIGYGIWRLTETQFEKILPVENSELRR